MYTTAPDEGAFDADADADDAGDAVRASAAADADADGNARAVADPDVVLDPSGIVSSTIGTLDALLLRLFAWFAAGDLPLFPETEKRRQPLHLDAARLAAIDPVGTHPSLRDRRQRSRARHAGHAVRRIVTCRRAARPPAVRIQRGARLRVHRQPARPPVRAARRREPRRHFCCCSPGRRDCRCAFARLSRAAAAAIDAEGRVAPSRHRARLVESGARDEIGQLSRDLSALLERSAAYTRYLERLSSRLSHELGTPLSIVRSSLENIAAERLDPESRTLVVRAGDGAERLGHIVRALLASTRLEQSVRHASFAPLELRAWLEEARDQYAQVHSGYRFRVVDSLKALERHESGGTAVPGRDPPLRATVAATLLRQALDKLVDNAVDFATEPDIALVLCRERGARSGRRFDDEAFSERVTLAVANVGAALGEEGRGAPVRGGLVLARGPA